MFHFNFYIQEKNILTIAGNSITLKVSSLEKIKNKILIANLIFRINLKQIFYLWELISKNV